VGTDGACSEVNAQFEAINSGGRRKLSEGADSVPVRAYWGVECGGLPRLYQWIWNISYTASSEGIVPEGRAATHTAEYTELQANGRKLKERRTTQEDRKPAGGSDLSGTALSEEERRRRQVEMAWEGTNFSQRTDWDYGTLRLDIVVLGSNDERIRS
jgi:hypothetical protein